jgi:pectinesterase
MPAVSASAFEKGFGSADRQRPPHLSGTIVLLDCYHNNEWKTTATGIRVRYHYMWNDTTDSGFSQLGGIISSLGAFIDTLCVPPDSIALAKASVFILVDPDTPRESDHPHVITPVESDAIEAWVRGGGILILLGNDRGNAEFEHLNELAGRFGIHFNEDSRNKVVGNDFSTGTFAHFSDHPVFAHVRKIFLKEISTLNLGPQASPVLTDKGDFIMAWARKGKGGVFAVGDPWMYNEYMDHRRLPGDYDNPLAAENLFRWLLGRAGEQADLIVAPDGSGDFRSIQEAIDKIQPSPGKRKMIFLRNGTYREKIFIQKSGIVLVGEDEDSTRIIYPELREEWNRNHGGSDWDAGVVNIDSNANDIVLANLTIYNDYGALHHEWNKHQFTIRGRGTRTILLRCTVKSDGGDAVSLWDARDGMYYHRDCTFEGWVDYVCPRGWCYIVDSKFYGHNTASASLWHDGSHDRRQKFVIVNSTFDGDPGFPLGRNHLDGQFFLIRCRFSRNMADRPFYRPPSSPREWQWGDRHYFFGCHRDGGDFAWFHDNLDEADGAPSVETIDARWTFDGKWDPEGTMPSVLTIASLPHPSLQAKGIRVESEVLTWVPGRNARSHDVYFGTANPPAFRERLDACQFASGMLSPRTTYYWRVDEIGPGGIVPGTVWSFTTE